MGSTVKVIRTVICGLLLLLLYALIFSFSGQDGETSSGLSRRISEKCVDIIEDISGENMTDLQKDRLTENLEHPIRKLAHFSEYACMGILVFTLLCPFLHKKNLILISLLWIALSAAADEIHQLFVPGRDGNIVDVLIDTSGGAAGILVCLVAVTLVQKAANKRNA